MSVDIANFGGNIIMTPHDWLNCERTVARSKKPYAHFDLRTDIKKQKHYISNPHNVATHGYYPFIHYQIITKKYNKSKGIKDKIRDICYAAHIDRCIYQYYSFILNELYNERVQIDGISDVVIAYRSDLHKSNIHFSKRAFDYIKELGQCFVMIGDFTHFFDNLDHAYLKRQWCSLLQCEQLPADHYSVFKNITAYSKWELNDLLALNGYRNDWMGRKSLNRQTRVLTPEQYKKNRSQIVKNPNRYGIPQGSPISAVLANVYMLEVDKCINDMLSNIGGLYMRYSDDFIIILPETVEAGAAKTFENVHAVLKTAPKLELEHSKTQYFHYFDGSLRNCGKEFYDEADDSSRFINFLGFTFDGKHVSIRAKTTAKYYYRMYRKAKNIAKAGGYTPSGKHISCKHLYQHYSEHGADGKPGNFLTYVQRAQNEYGSTEAIQRDTKRHMQKIRQALNGKHS